MPKKIIAVLCLLLLQACASHPAQRSEDESDRVFFADASQCYESTAHKQQIQLNVGGNNTQTAPSVVTPINIELPSAPDADAYNNCMVGLGHRVPKVSAAAYLQASQSCLEQSRGADNPNEAYAACIRHGSLQVESIGNRQTQPLKVR